MDKPTITLFTGTAKKSGKEYTALKLDVGSWSKLYFVDSQFELDYIKKYIRDLESTESAIDLSSDD